MSFFRATITILLILCLGFAAYAQDFEQDSDTTNITHLFDLNNIMVGDYYVKQNAFQYTLEKVNQKRQIFYNEYMSWQNGYNKFIDGLLSVRDFTSNTTDIILGAQVLNDLSTFFSYQGYYGWRLDWYKDNLSAGVYDGNLRGTSTLLMPQDDPNTPHMKGLTLRYQADSTTVLQLEHTVFDEIINYSATFPVRWRSNANSITGITLNTLILNKIPVQYSFASSSNSTVGVFAKPRDISSLFKTNFSSGSFNFNIDSQYYGLFFGPQIDTNSQAGRYTLNAYSTYTISNNISMYNYWRDYNSRMTQEPNINIQKQTTMGSKLNFNFQKYPAATFTYEDNISQGLTSDRLQSFSKTNNLITELSYSLFNIFSLRGLYQITSTYDIFNNKATGKNIQIQRNLGLPYINRWGQLSFSSQKTVNYPMTSDNVGVSSSNSLQYFVFPKSMKWDFTANYQKNVNLSTTASVSKVISLAANYKFSPRFLARGSYYQTRQNNAQYPTSYVTITGNYILDEHSELLLSYQNGFPTNMMYQAQGGVQLALQLIQSWGGGYNAMFKEAFRGKIKAVAFYDYSGKGVPDKKSIMLKNIPISLNGKDPKDTGEDGAVLFKDLTSGVYKVTLDTKDSPLNYELKGSPTLEIKMGHGQVSTIYYPFAGFGTLYAITWNDYLEDHQIQQGYIGFPSIKIITPDGKIMETNEDGALALERLPVGRYKIALDEKALPPGLAPTTPAVQEVTVEAGQDTIVSFGLKGVGSMSGYVYLIPENEYVSGKKILSKANVVLDERLKAPANDKGFYEFAEIAAGSHRVKIETPDIATKTYLTGDEKVNIKPTDKRAIDLILAYFGKITGNVFEDRNGNGVLDSGEKTFDGVVINFTGDPEYIYTDSEGRFDFEGLKMGNYTVSLDKDYVPEGYRLISNATVLVALKSGENKVIHFKLVKQ